VYERDSDHPFITDQPHLQASVIIEQSHQRNEAVGGEVNMTNLLTGFADHLGKVKFDRFAVGQNLLMVFAGQSGQQTINKEN